MTVASFLPEIVLQRIFDYALPTHLGTPMYWLHFVIIWKHGLRFLAVCSHWRSAAERLVYSDVFVFPRSFINPFKAKVLPDGLVTNIHLALANRKQSAMTRLVVRLASPDFAADIEELNAIVGGVPANALSKISKLELSFKTPAARLASGNSLQVVEQQIQNAAARFVGFLPSVTYVKCHELGPCPNMAAFVAYLGDSYAAKVCLLHSLSAINFTSHQFGAQLQHLRISEPQNMQVFSLPLISAQSVKTLALASLRPDFIWQTRFYGLESTNLKFSNLRQLQLRFSRSHTRREVIASDNVPVHVHFPTLKVLELFDCPHTDTLFQQATITPNLQCLNVRSSISTLSALSRTRIATVGSLEITLYGYERVSTHEFADTLNHFYNHVRSRKSGLCIYTHAFALDTHEIRWPYLQSVFIKAPVPFTTILRLIPCMQSLHYLSLAELEFDHDAVTLLTSQDSNIGPELPTPISQTIRTLCFTSCVFGTTETVFSAAKYVALRCPLLEKISAYDKLLPLVCGLFDHELKPQGHFTQVKVC